MCVTDGHDMTLAVKVALNPNTNSRGLSGKGLTDTGKQIITGIVDHFQLALKAVNLGSQHAVY